MLVLALSFVTTCVSLLETLRLRKRYQRSQAENAFLSNERNSERQGRIRAEKKLREGIQAKDNQVVTYPLKPIGYIKSCFSQRNGTPRQPLLVKNARSTLTLRAELTEDFCVD